MANELRYGSPRYIQYEQAILAEQHNIMQSPQYLLSSIVPVIDLINLPPGAQAIDIPMVNIVVLGA